MSSTTVEVNGTENESDALPLTLHAYNNDDVSPVPVSVLNSGLVNDEPVQTRFTIDESIVTTNCVSSEKNEPKSPLLSSSMALVVTASDYQHPETETVMENGLGSSPVSSPVASKRRNGGRNKWEGLIQSGVRRSPRLSTPTYPLIEGPKVKRIKSCVDKVNVEGGNESCGKLALTACKKKQSKGKRGLFFVGEPVPEHEALERWGWRYELKV